MLEQDLFYNSVWAGFLEQSRRKINKNSFGKKEDLKAFYIQGNFCE